MNIRVFYTKMFYTKQKFKTVYYRNYITFDRKKIRKSWKMS